MVYYLFDVAQIFIVKSMIIQQTSSWMLSLLVKKREITMTIDFKVDPDNPIIAKHFN